MKRALTATTLALCFFAPSSASAATCEQLKAASIAVAGLVKSIQEGKVSAADGLKAGIAEVTKLDLTAETKKKVADRTGPVLAKDAAATSAEVLPLFADAAKDLGTEAGAQKCPA